MKIHLKRSGELVNPKKTIEQIYLKVATLSYSLLHVRVGSVLPRLDVH